MLSLFPDTITPDELETLRKSVPDLCVLDVRTPAEYFELGHLPEATLLPIQVLDQFVNKLNPSQPTVVICEHGVRSTHACHYLKDQGFGHLYNLGCGMAGWPGDRNYDPPGR